MRRLRALFFSNNGLGAGHLARSLAVARALGKKAPELESAIITSSQADALLAAVPIAAIRFPSPSIAQRSNWSDETRREVASRVVRGVIEGFQPDILVTDTFPLGPHDELVGLLRKVRHRVLVRRTVRQNRGPENDAAERGLEEHHLAIVPADPYELREEKLPIPLMHVPPITLFEAEDALDRIAARKRLGLPAEGRFILVASGGGGDPEAAERAVKIAETIARAKNAVTPMIAVGPLGSKRAHAESMRSIVETPIQPHLAAFDGVIAPAGYNFAHEVAKAGVPLALYAMQRPYDDQWQRAKRFEKAGLAHALETTDDDAIAAAIAWMENAPRPQLPADGAARAADAILDLVVNA